MKTILKYSFVLLLSCLVLSSYGQGKKAAKKMTSKSTWKKIAKLLGKNGDSDLGSYIISNGTEVIGTEPSWVLEHASTEYPFNLLTTIVIGEYDIHPLTGEPRYLPSLRAHRKKLSNKAGEETNLAKAAKTANSGIKALISLTYYNDFKAKNRPRYNYNYLLTSEKVMKNLSATINEELKLLQEVGYGDYEYGVVIDFEGWEEVPNAEESLPKFLKELSSALVSGSLIYFKLPANTYTRSIRPNLVEAINETNLIDYYIIKGYGFESDVKQMNAISPIKRDGADIASTTNHYAQVLDKSQMVLESPFYGTVWRKKNGISFQPDAQRFLMPYNKIVKDFVDGEPYRKDTKLDSASFAFFDTGEKRFVFEDDTLLQKTYQWAKADSLGGVGLMALGYADTDDQEIWWAIAKEYGIIPQPLGWTIAGFLSMFMFGGFFYSVLHYWEVRNSLAVYRNYLVNIGGFALLTLLIFLLCMNIIPRGVVGALILGAIMLIFLIYKTFRRYLAKVKKVASYAK